MWVRPPPPFPPRLAIIVGNTPSSVRLRAPQHEAAGQPPSQPTINAPTQSSQPIARKVGLATPAARPAAGSRWRAPAPPASPAQDRPSAAVGRRRGPPPGQTRPDRRGGGGTATLGPPSPAPGGAAGGCSPPPRRRPPSAPAPGWRTAPRPGAAPAAGSGGTAPPSRWWSASGPWSTGG